MEGCGCNGEQRGSTGPNALDECRAAIVIGNFAGSAAKSSARASKGKSTKRRDWSFPRYLSHFLKPPFILQPCAHVGHYLVIRLSPVDLATG